jgi:two-component system CheB/CheR fusion protein
MATKKKGKRTAAAAAKKPFVATPPDSALDDYVSSVFPIIGVGTSAGGLEAMNELLHDVPPDGNLAFVVIQHHDPKTATALPQILGRATKMPVKLAENGMEVAPNTVYVAPADAELTISRGVLRVGEPSGRLTMPIDAFLRSLAEDQGSRAIGVILSGAASDGTLGAKAIKAEGGITFAQDDSARFDSMPRSAVAGGAIDFVLSPKEIARELQRIARHSYLSGVRNAAERLPENELVRVFAMLRSAHDVDFTHYKPATVERRIRRRMALQKTETLSDYLELLQKDSKELEHLYADILIRVTGFFRDPEVFEALQRDIFPAIVAEHEGSDAPVRIWVPGCATGEEVYTFAMAFLEARKDGFACPVQIFGTDVSEQSIERARAGIYPENIATEVSAERLRRFFTKIDGGYRVSKIVRDCCIFARQDLTKDPPFSKLDLISCRNVMIYLGAVLQRRVTSIFHYALRPMGYLLLGSSETIGNFGDLFTITDRRHKIYQKKTALQRPEIDFTAPVMREHTEQSVNDKELPSAANIFRDADRVLLARFSPSGVLVSDQMEILHFRGRTSTFLEPAPGAASFNLLKMAREGLLAELRTAIQVARKREQPVRREGLRIRSNSHIIHASIEVIPFISGGNDRFFLILFQENAASEQPPKGRKKAPAKEAKEVERLKRELDATRDYLQSIIEEQEAMNEELRSANEEIQSSNEELQSINEELETAKEELQSSNEELITLNEELENRNQELAQVNNDLLNLLASVDIPIVMLDSALRIRRFNPGAQRALNLSASDLGRSIRDIQLPFSVDQLDNMIMNVIDNLETRELQARHRDGRRYLLRVRPYRTTDNRIEGAVMVMIDVDQVVAAKVD